MHLRGEVKLDVTTDGHRITHIKVSGQPILAEEAINNVRTWTLADHNATSFVVTYYYALEHNYKDKKDPVTNCSATMNLPTKVMVKALFIPFPAP